MKSCQIVKRDTKPRPPVPTPPPTSDIITACDGSTTTETVDSKVSIVGAENAIPVRIIEDCGDDVSIDYEYVCNKDTGFYDLHTFTTTNGVPSSPVISATTIKCDVAVDTFDEEVYCNGTTNTQWIRTVSFTEEGVKTVESEVDSLVPCTPSASVKSIVKKTDCSGTTASVDTTKTVEAVIDQVVDVKTCNKKESVSEVLVCASGTTLSRKTTIDSEGTETVVFYGDDGAVATPANYTIGECQIVFNEDEYNTGCSSVDGRLILQKISTDETGTTTVTILESDGVTEITDGSQLVKCSGADYEKVETCKTDGTDLYKMITFINSSDTTDNFIIWVDKTGAIIPPVAGATDCPQDKQFDLESTCLCVVDDSGAIYPNTQVYNVFEYSSGAVTLVSQKVIKDGAEYTLLATDTIQDCKTASTVQYDYERCFDTGSGTVTVSGHYIVTGIPSEVYITAIVIKSNDSSINVGDDVLASVGGWTQIACNYPTPIQKIGVKTGRQSGSNTFSAPYRSLTITAISEDVKINGDAVPLGFTWSVSSQEFEEIGDDTVIDGSDYFITITFNN